MHEEHECWQMHFEEEGRHDEAGKYYKKAWASREQIDGVHGFPLDKDSIYTSVMLNGCLESRSKRSD